MNPDKKHRTDKNLQTRAQEILSKPMNRRGFFGALAGVSAAGVLAACGSQSSTQSQNLHGPDLSGVDPGTPATKDLYWHVNGKAIDETVLPPDKTRVATFSEIADQTDDSLHSIIEGINLDDVSESSEDYKIRALYDSFMDEERINQRGIEPLQGFLDAIEEAQDKLNLTRIMADYSKVGMASYISWLTDADQRDAENNGFYLGSGSLGLGQRDFYEKEQYESLRAAYLDYLTTLAQLSGLPADSAQNVLDFETQLSGFTLYPEQSRDAEATYNKVSWSDFQKNNPGFDWERWMSISTEGGQQPSDVIVDSVDNMKKVSTLWADTDLAILKQYIVLNSVAGWAEYLSTPFSEAALAFAKVSSGLESYPPRWKRAISALNASIGEALGKKYVAAEFPESSKKDVQDLVDNLIKAYHDSLQNLSWMSSETQKAAQAKLDKMTIKIGYPDKWEKYSDVSIDPKKLVENLMSANEYAYAQGVERINKSVDKSKWFMNPQTVNAYFNPTANEIVFPAAILQGAFFNPDANDATNFGGIGSVIGHEIGHSFDDQGSKYDGRGNLNDWWKDSDREAYEKLVNALIEQYDGLVPKGLPENNTVKGALTVGENLADLGGLSVSVRALKIKLGKDSAPADASSDEVVSSAHGDYGYLEDLFLNYARIWRTVSRPEAAEQLLESDPHAPGEFRANQPPKNVPDFYVTFNVHSGDGMYIDPDKRVQVW